MNRSQRTGLVLALLLLPAAACRSADGDPVALASELGENTLFLAQTRPADVGMEALFDGAVERDDRGCLRLAGGDHATVVWPYGFTLSARRGGLYVVTPEGRAIGRIGGSFRLGGGEIPALHDGLALTGEQRAQAAQRCPGRYWIVGDVP